MTTIHRPATGRTTTAPAPGRRRPALLVPPAIAALLAVGCAMLGPASVVADARAAVMAAVEAVAAPWFDTVHRAPVEAVANALLFVPVGALAALALRRRHPLLPLAVGAAASVLVEIAQAALPGRVPDPADVVANITGTAIGVALVVACLASSRRAARRRTRRLVAALTLLLLAGLAACSSAGQAHLAAPSGEAPVSTPSGGTRGVAPSGQAHASAPSDRARDGAAPSVEDGYVGKGAWLSPLDDVPAITALDSALRRAVQDAARDAETDGVELRVTSGWRSAAYQRSLFDDAVARYGSPDAARAYVLGPDRSAHVTGHAVDIGPTDATSWLSQHGVCATIAARAGLSRSRPARLSTAAPGCRWSTPDRWSPGTCWRRSPSRSCGEKGGRPPGPWAPRRLPRPAAGSG